MKRTLFTAFIILLFTASLVLAQDASVYNTYKISTFKYQTLKVMGNNLLDWYTFGDTKHMYMDPAGEYRIYNQTPEFTWYSTDNLHFNYSKINDLDATNTLDLDLYGGVEKYFMGYTGPHAFGTAEFYYSKYSEDDDPNQHLELNLGAGYGRVTNATPVAFAVAIAKDVGGGASNEKVLKIAEIIDQWPQYQYKYKDDAEIMFYNDLAKAAGKPEAAMKVRQIYTASYYHISTRSVGWHVRGSYNNQFMISPEPAENPKGSFLLRGDYAKPLDLDKQVLAWAEYAMSFEEDTDPDMEFGARGTMDHTFNWASYAQFLYHSYGATPALDSHSYMELTAGTNKAILNKLTAGAAFSYGKDSEIDDAVMSFLINFTYWIW
jgi:hypothetical protein